MDLSGKNAIVTGGSLGIGAAIAKKLGEYGANVAVNYRKHDAEAKAVVGDIKKMGRKGLVVQADVSSTDDAEAMVNQVAEEFGGLDILVCNAGIAWNSIVWKMTEEQWDRVLDVNLKGTWNYIRAAAPIFKEKEAGKIVTISSINGLRGKVGQTNYSASKGGMIALTKAVAKELGRYHVNVNCVAPGAIATDIWEGASDEVIQTAVAEIVLGRMGEPEEVANVVAFLCSDEANFITGEVLKVDGGQYI